MRLLRLSSDFRLDDRKYGSVGHSSEVKKAHTNQLTARAAKCSANTVLVFLTSENPLIYAHSSLDMTHQTAVCL